MATYINNVFGLVTGTSTQTAASFPNIPAEQVNFQTHYDNKESFFIGTPDHVLWDLPPNKETGWVKVSNLNQLQFYSVSGSAERLIYWVQR